VGRFKGGVFREAENGGGGGGKKMKEHPTHKRGGKKSGRKTERQLPLTKVLRKDTKTSRGGNGGDVPEPNAKAGQIKNTSRGQEKGKLKTPVSVCSMRPRNREI